MAKKKISRKELLKQPDEFLTFSSKAVTFFNAHLRELKVLGYILAMLVVAYLAVNAYLRHVNKKGQEAYNAGYYELTENLKPETKPEVLDKAGKLFEKVIDEYGFSKAARLAYPQVAYVDFLGGKFDDAIASYQKFLTKVSGDKKYQILTDLAIAASYEAKGDFKLATETLAPILKTANDPFKETVMLSLARLYRLDNQTEKAKEILKEFVEQYKDSPFLPMAKAYL